MELIGALFYLVITIYILVKTALAIRIVPAQQVFVVERLGKYRKSLEAGFHLLFPFLDRVAYKLTLKEEAIDVPAQICITRDNVKVGVDGVVYMRVVNSERAAYNITNYRYGLIQLAQTTMRSVFGHLDLDKTFEERESVNQKIVEVVDQAAEHWGIKILRYEIQNISPPKTVLDAMERQMTAEREKRAVIARSEGDMQSVINRSEGDKQELINRSEGEKQKMINEAEGRAKEILALGVATAQSIRKISGSLNEQGGKEAMWLGLYQDYLRKFKNLARPETQVILPMNLAEPGEILNGLRQIHMRKQPKQ